MTHGAETPDTLQDAEVDHAGAADRSIALIGPNASSRSVMARALAGSGAVAVREYVSYPARLGDLPHILERNCSLIMIDVDSDESYALAIVQKLVATSSAIVMVYSTRNQPELIARCIQAGARDFLPLPAEEEAVAAPEAGAPEPVLAEPEPTAVEPAPETVVAAPPSLEERPVPQPEVAKEKAAPPPLQLPEWERPVVPVFRPVGAAPPPGTRRIPKWLIAVAFLAVAAGVAMVFLQPLRLLAAHGMVLPWNHASRTGVASPAAGENSALVPSELPSSNSAVAASSAGDLRPAVPAASHGAAVDSGAMDAQLNAPARIAGSIKKPEPSDEPATGFTPGGIDTGNANSIPGAAFAGKSNVQVVPSVSAISAGVAAGLLIHKTEPVYPRFARDAHMSGTVVLGATINKTGAIENLHVVRGPAALVDAALNAARTWRYRPYELNGQPIEVQTTINIVFKLDK